MNQINPLNMQTVTEAWEQSSYPSDGRIIQNYHANGCHGTTFNFTVQSTPDLPKMMSKGWNDTNFDQFHYDLTTGEIKEGQAEDWNNVVENPAHMQNFDWETKRAMYNAEMDSEES